MVFLVYTALLSVNLVLLFLFNLVAGLFGAGLAINLVNVLVAGILGIPGIVLLVIFSLVL